MKMLPVRNLAAAAATLAVIGFGLAGCGINPDQASNTAGHSGADARFELPPEAVNTGQSEARATVRKVGVIRIAGRAQGSLTERLVSGYTGAARIEMVGGSDQSAFRDFCGGQIDIVDSSRPISAEEYRRCVANGIQPVQFQVASDAAVLAIRNETNVGADCLSLDEVYNIFRAGSSINGWSQVGYGHEFSTDREAIRMKVVGPDQNSNVFGFFAEYVLGDSDPSMLSLRSDYRAFPTDVGVRRAVVGTSRDYRAAQRYEASVKVLEEIRASLAENRQAVKDAEAEVAKGIRDGRTPAAKRRDQRLLRQARANLENLERSLPASEAYVRLNREARRRLTRTIGTLGLFRFSYYEAFEEQLRPMEISSSNNFNQPECIFPSQATVTDGTYPLARQLMLTVNYSNMRDPDINDFLDSSLSRSQQMAESTALVPLPDDVRDRERSWLDGSSEPDVVVYGDKTTTVVGSD